MSTPETPMPTPDRETPRGEAERTLVDLAEFACDHLPDRWTLKVVMRAGMLDAILTTPGGEMLEPRDGEDVDLAPMIRRRVNAARIEDGLCPVGWDGEQDTDWYDDERERTR